MDENTIVMAKIKAQLSTFSGIISKDFPKAKKLKAKRDRTEDFQLCFSFW